MPTPLIIQLEQEIDREIENDAKLQKQLEEEDEVRRVRNQSVVGNNNDNDDDNTNLDVQVGHEGLDNDRNTNNNRNGKESDIEVEHQSVATIQQETNGKSSDDVKELDNEKQPKQGEEEHQEKEEEIDYCEEDFGPKPQVITNDLLSLHEKVVQLLCQCSCATQFPMVRIGDGKYKVGDKLIIFVRILRRHIMVRVGGGWQELSEFLRQKDPCRAKQHHFNSHQQPQQHQQPYSLTINNVNHQNGTETTTNKLTPATLTTATTTNGTSGNSIVSKSRFLVGSSHHLNKGHHHYKHSGVPRLISGSASMSWLSHNA